MNSFRVLFGGLLLVLVTPVIASAAAPPNGKVPAKAADASKPIEHTVTRGETMWSISQKHHTSVGAIMDYNHLTDHNVHEGTVLRIPPTLAEATPAPVSRERVHVVKRGEDFWDIATHYGIKPEALAKANPNVNPNRVHADMELIIPGGEQSEKTIRRDEGEARPQTSATQQAPAGMIQHTVTEDETFYSISRHYGVSMDAVVAANPNVRPERLAPGIKVWVPSKNASTAAKPKDTAPSPKAADSAPKTADSSKPAANGRTHKVKEDESIASIAKKYGVSESALLRANKLAESDAIYVDDVLKIPGGGAEIATTKTPQTKSTAVTSSKSPAPETQAKTQSSTPIQTKTQSSVTQSKAQASVQQTKSETSSPQPKAQAATAPVKQPGAPESSAASGGGAIRSYIVSAGEDENTICEAFGISKKALFDYNRLAPTAKLKPGDEIAIPGGAKGRKG